MSEGLVVDAGSTGSHSSSGSSDQKLPAKVTCVKKQSAKDDYEKELAEALASLQLPQMPCAQEQEDLPPTVTILVCADIDLASTAALAEYLLMEQPHITVDLIIAAGPCTRNDDLLSYSRGSTQRGKYKRRQQQQHRRHQYPSSPQSYASGVTSEATDAVAASFGNYQSSGCNSMVVTPFYRSHEESAALEGLMTAALSQLESIVCRVVYCPGLSDPLSVVLDSKRLTPNSRNLNRQWLPMVPGLGCAGLFYLDGTEHVMTQYSASAASAYNDDDSDASDDEVRENTAMVLAEQLKKLQR